MSTSEMLQVGLLVMLVSSAISLIGAWASVGLMVLEIRRSRGADPTAPTLKLVRHRRRAWLFMGCFALSLACLTAIVFLGQATYAS